MQQHCRVEPGAGPLDLPQLRDQGGFDASTCLAFDRGELADQLAVELFDTGVDPGPDDLGDLAVCLFDQMLLRNCLAAHRSNGKEAQRHRGNQQGE